MSYPLRFPSQEPILTLTHPSSSIWVIELHNGEDNRLTQRFIQNAIIPALDHVELAWRNSVRDAKAKKDKEGGKGALVITGKRSQDKFFSNGFDYQSVVGNPAFFPNVFNPLVVRLLSFPMPTVVAINGHVFAAGFVLSLICDYRVITSDKQRKVWGSMNEVHFGAPLPSTFSDIIKAKTLNPQIERKIVLEGHRFTPAELLAAGLVDAVVDGGSEAVLANACQLAEKWSGNARQGVWGMIRKSTYGDIVDRIKLDLRQPTVEEDEAQARARL